MVQFISSGNGGGGGGGGSKATITIQQEGVTAGSFNLNQKTDSTIDLDYGVEYMSQAEYDALPSSKLTDGVNRVIYDNIIPIVKVLLRPTNNLLAYDSDDELYADLQMENGMTPTSAFPIGVTVGNVDSTDGWTQSGVMINARTTDGAYMRWLYGDDGKLYFDGGLGVFKTIATTDDISSALGDLRNELSTVAFTGLSSDLNNDAGFDSVPVMTQSQYDNTPGTAGDNKRYLIFEEV